MSLCCFQLYFFHPCFHPCFFPASSLFPSLPLDKFPFLFYRVKPPCRIPYPANLQTRSAASARAFRYSLSPALCRVAGWIPLRMSCVFFPGSCRYSLPPVLCPITGWIPRKMSYSCSPSAFRCSLPPALCPITGWIPRKMSSSCSPSAFRYSLPPALCPITG